MNTPTSNKFEDILRLSQTWLESKEFNEQYIQTHHPYPPLLNPKMLEDEHSACAYRHIPADFAWEANLPLPPGYLFLFVMMSHSGHSSMVSYLKKCGVHIMQDHLFGPGWMKKNYEFTYDALLKKEPTVINFTSYNTAGEDWFLDLDKLLHLIHPKTRVLCLVRDPLPRLKTSLNNYLGKDFHREMKLQYYFNENDDLSGLENRVQYVFNMAISFKDRLEYSLTLGNTFRYSEIYEKLLALGFQQFDFLDIQKIIEPRDIFNLMTRLAKEYHFSPPKSVEDFEIPEHRVYTGFLPLLYEVRGVQFLITQFQDKEGNVEVSNILGLDLSWFAQLGKAIFVYTTPIDLPIIQENFNHIQQKINVFLNKLKEVINFEQTEHLTSVHALLEFFKTHPRHRQLFKKVTQKEVEFVLENRPDIVEQWKDYLEFKKLCDGLD